MIVLPLPLVISLITGFLTLRLVLLRGRVSWLAGLLGLCTGQTALVAATQYYGVSALMPLQAITAPIIPPLAWITFQTGALGPLRPQRVWLHGIGPVLVVSALLFLPQMMDPVIIGTFLIYGAAILWRLRGGRDALPLARLQDGDLPGMIWHCLGGVLILSALGDFAIATVIGYDRTDWAGQILSATSSLVLLIIGLLSLSETVADPAAQEAEPPGAASVGADETDLVADLDRLLAEEQLFLDPGLTLARLARRLGVPAKSLSAAVNRATGQNVSRHINAHRIGHACKALRAGETVTGAMLASGFNTKSNFNREFSRVTGTTPSKWRTRSASAPTNGD